MKVTGSRARGRDRRGVRRLGRHRQLRDRPAPDAAAATTTSTSSALPFQIPLGALIPQRVENLLPACKNIGTTHITNGCYRLHPVEWNIGEAAGVLAALCIGEEVVAARRAAHATAARRVAAAAGR